MANTTNFNWETPDDTDLVKDGASAIRTLGSAIDTTTKNLNPSTTLGDIEYRSSTANTNTRLAIGTSGQVLTVSGGVPAWTTLSSGAYTQLATGTLSGSSVTLSSIDQTYRQLVFQIYGLDFASNETLRVQFNGDTATNYTYISTSSANLSTNLAYWMIGSNQSDSVNSGFTQIILPNYSNTATWKIGQLNHITVEASNTATANYYNQWGWYKSTSAISSLKLYGENAQNFAGGTYYLYGVK